MISGRQDPVHPDMHDIQLSVVRFMCVHPTPHIPHPTSYILHPPAPGPWPLYAPFINILLK